MGYASVSESWELASHCQRIILCEAITLRPRRTRDLQLGQGQGAIVSGSESQSFVCSRCTFITVCKRYVHNCLPLGKLEDTLISKKKKEKEREKRKKEKSDKVNNRLRLKSSKGHVSGSSDHCRHVIFPLPSQSLFPGWLLRRESNETFGVRTELIPIEFSCIADSVIFIYSHLLPTREWSREHPAAT